MFKCLVSTFKMTLFLKKSVNIVANMLEMVYGAFKEILGCRVVCQLDCKIKLILNDHKLKFQQFPKIALNMVKTSTL